MIDVNRFILKYDFQVANKIKPLPPNEREFLSKDSQAIFKKMAYMEVLQECSDLLGHSFPDGEGMPTQFHSMFDYKTREFIPSLEEIPQDCNLILVSPYRH